MAQQVVRTEVDAKGAITALVGNGFHADKDVAVRQIEAGAKSYSVSRDGRLAPVRVVTAADGSKHLRTDPDSTLRNNLGELPSC